MKIVCIPDIHGSTLWLDILQKENPDIAVFIGDYFDTFEDISAAEQIHNFKEIIHWKKENPQTKVILLRGNHDMYDYPDLKPFLTAGYQYGAAPAISQVLEENKEHLQIIYQFDNIVFTHAGISQVWLENNGFVWEKQEDFNSVSTYIEELWKYKPRVFAFTGTDSSGDNMCQTPIWIRPRSLMKASKDLRKQIIQVVGHTAQDCIDIKGKSTGGRYYFIDTLGTSKEYLIIQNNEFTCGKLS